MSANAFTHHLIPLLRNYGTTPARDEGEIPMTWRLFHPDTMDTCEIANDAAHVVEYHNKLHAGYLDDDEMTTAPRSLKTDGRAAMTDGTENEG